MAKLHVRSQSLFLAGMDGGIVTATVLAVFLVPLFFLVVGRLFRLRKAPRTGNSPQIPTEQA
ncbi:hypothetical protein KUC87_26380 [Pseudomonas aeruginosa]|nr:hypothetical protein [Pseudomonas aeruginosa]MCV0122473.1 hypothetical protein [Pseudomonas aeruginosa]